LSEAKSRRAGVDIRISYLKRTLLALTGPDVTTDLQGIFLFHVELFYVKS